MEEKTRAALSDQETWLRLPVMLLFFLMLVVATPLLIVVSSVGWLIRLFTGEQSDGVIEFGQDIGRWFRRCSDYLVGAAERRPFPFEDHDCPSDRAVVESSRSRSSAPAGSGERAASASSAAGSSDAAPETTASGPASEAEDKPVERATATGEASKKKSAKKKSTRKKATKKKSRSNKAAAGKASGGAKASTAKTARGSTKPEAGSSE
jgi:hypothetical protein